jgi:hypothetical protein
MKTELKLLASEAIKSMHISLGSKKFLSQRYFSKESKYTVLTPKVKN